MMRASTAQPPRTNPLFQQAMLERQIPIRLVPERLTVINQSFPAAQAAMEAMKEIGITPILSR